MSQIAFFIESFRVYWFGIVIAIAALVSVLVALLFRRLQGKDSRAVLFTAVLGSIFSLYFARIVHWYCCAHQYDSFNAAITNLKDGGFSLLGVFAGCTLAIMLARWLRMEDDIASLFDCVAPAGAIGICIGRLGALFTTSDKGKHIITSPDFQRLPYAVQLDAESGGDWQFASFAFESIAAAIAFIVTVLFFSKIYSSARSGSSYRHGDAALIFVAFFGATQAVLESTRYDALFMRSNGFVSMMQVLSSIALAAVLVVFSIRAVRNTGFMPKYAVLWSVSLLLIGAAILFEYLVQRYGDMFVPIYAGMSLCMMSVFLITLVFSGYSVSHQYQRPYRR